MSRTLIRLALVTTASMAFSTGRAFPAPDIEDKPPNSTDDAQTLESLYKQAEEARVERRDDDALRLYRRVVELDPENPARHDDMSEAYLRARRYPDALAATLRAAELARNLPAGIEPSETAIAIVDHQGLRRERMSRLCFEILFHGGISEARAALARIVAVEATFAEPRLKLAELDQRTGDLESALEGYRKVVEILGDTRLDLTVDAQVHVAECLYGLGKRKDAVEQYQMIVDEYARYLPRVYGVESILESLRSASPDAPAHRIQEIRIPLGLEKNHSFPVVLSVLLRYWGCPADVRGLGADLVRKGRVSTLDAANYVTRRHGLAVRYFLVRPEPMKRLLDAGIPVLLRHAMLRCGHEGHVSVVVGYDDALGMFLLEDVARVTGTDYLAYAQATGRHGMLVAPKDRLCFLGEALPGEEYCVAMNTADDAREKGDMERAEALYREAKQLHPESSLCHFRLGEVVWKRGNLEEARVLLEKASSLPGAEDYTYFYLGEVCVEQGRTLRGEEALRLAIDVEPRFELAHRRLALLFAGRGDSAKALVHAQQFCSLSETDPGDQVFVASLLYRLGRLQEAEKVLNRALVCGARPFGKFLLAKVYDRLGRFDLAIEQLRQYVKAETDPEERKTGEILLRAWSRFVD